MKCTSSALVCAFALLCTVAGARGNSQESEYILLIQDDIPMEMEWIGYPTLYYIPVAEGISEVQMIRGGSGLRIAGLMRYAQWQANPNRTTTLPLRRPARAGARAPVLRWDRVPS